MNIAALLKSLMVLLLIGGLTAAPLRAAQPERPGSVLAVAVQQDDDDAEGVTFDNLLPASGYTLYIEARNIGALLHSAEFRETFEPITPLLEMFGGRGTEFRLVRLIIDNADRLQQSRVMFAFSPTDSSLPGQILAIEMESEDMAQEFETEMQNMAQVMATTGPNKFVNAKAKDKEKSAPGLIRRAGKLLVLSATPFSFKALRGKNDKLMSDDLNFRSARSHFYAEPLFIYYDMALAGHRKESAASPRQPAGEPASATGTQNTTSAQSVVAVAATPVAVTPTEAPSPASASSRSSTTPQNHPVQAPAARSSQPPAPPPVVQAGNQPPAPADQDLLGSLFSLLLSGEGQAQSNDALAVALTLENDALAVRALLITAPGATVGPLPFLSLPVSGPAISSEAANYLPADTDIFVVASLDWPRFYDLAALQSRTPRRTPYGRSAQPQQGADFDARRAAFEKANEVRLADLLGATLGNEIALSVPVSYLSGTPLGHMPLKASAALATPLLLVAVRDREALEAKLRPLLETFGMKFTNAKATTEKAGDIEITSYGNLAYAFINNYLMITSSPAAIRQAIEARLKHTTLAASRDFQSYTAWQPRAMIAHIYISAKVLKGLLPDRSQRDEIQDEAAKEFLARYHFDPEPVTYAASAVGVGAHYELRIPRHMLMRFFAELSVGEIDSRVPRNESMARSFLQSLKEQEKNYKKKHGRYGGVEELEAAQEGSVWIERFGYKLELTASDSGYEAMATPVEYGKTGRLSFYMDQSGVVREGDHQGKPASSADKPIDPKREY